MSSGPISFEHAVPVYGSTAPVSNNPFDPAGNTLPVTSSAAPVNSYATAGNPTPQTNGQTTGLTVEGAKAAVYNSEVGRVIIALTLSSMANMTQLEAIYTTGTETNNI